MAPPSQELEPPANPGRFKHENGVLKKKRSAKDAASFDRAIEAFVADVLRASAAGAPGAYRSLDKNKFNTDEDTSVGYRSFVAAKDALVGLGLIDRIPGSQRYVQAFGGSWNRPGVASIFTATPALVGRASEALEDLQNLQNHFAPELPKQPLVLHARSLRQGRDKVRGDKLPIDPDDKIANKLRAEVQSINEFLAGFTIEGGSHHGYRRVFNCGDDRDFKWDKGGRLFSIGDHNYQQMPATREGDRPGRDEITIDGQKVVEIDIRSCNLTLFYRMIGKPLDLATDPFGDLGIDRTLAKFWVNASLGAGKLIGRWPPEFVKDYAKDHGRRPEMSAGAVGAKVLEKLPDLKRLEDADAPKSEMLQFLESQIIIATMIRLMNAGIPSLAIHDSLIIPEEFEEMAKVLLVESFERTMGVKPVVTTKGTS